MGFEKPAARVSAAIIVALFSLSGIAKADETCWSILKSKFGPNVIKAIDKADPCKNVPGGFDVKEEFTVRTLDLCSAPSGVKIISEARVECRTSDSAFFKASVKGDLLAEVELDIGACKIVDSNVSVKGAIGELLSGSNVVQKSIQIFAQQKLNEMCKVN